LIVLRSFGKFFGLAGARLGFVLAERHLLRLLANRSGRGPSAGRPGWWARRACWTPTPRPASANAAKTPVSAWR
jgi:aspartate/methionine/tyrosine aminotransferase